MTATSLVAAVIKQALRSFTGTGLASDAKAPNRSDAPDAQGNAAWDMNVEGRHPKPLSQPPWFGVGKPGRYADVYAGQRAGEHAIRLFNQVPVYLSASKNRSDEKMLHICPMGQSINLSELPDWIEVDFSDGHGGTKLRRKDQPAWWGTFRLNLLWLTYRGQ